MKNALEKYTDLQLAASVDIFKKLIKSAKSGASVDKNKLALTRKKLRAYRGEMLRRFLRRNLIAIISLFFSVGTFIVAILTLLRT